MKESERVRQQYSERDSEYYTLILKILPEQILHKTQYLFLRVPKTEVFHSDGVSFYETHGVQVMISPFCWPEYERGIR